MRKWLKQAGIALLCPVFLSGCGTEEAEVLTQQEVEEIRIPVTFRVEPTTNVAENQDFAENFNAEYKGTYQLDVEWLTENAAGYRNKLKQWNVLDEMPAIITDAGFDNDFYELLVENDRLVDLRPYMEKSDFWMDAMNPDILADSTEEDGSIYLSPLGSSVWSYAGLLYNTDLLEEAGYEGIPQTWDEFFVCLEMLKDAGITPLALHGSGSYWVPMLISTAYIYRTEEGKAFLGEEFPETFQNDSMRELLEIFQKLYQYTFEDAVDLEYEQASSRFLNGEAAIFANGYWMFSGISSAMREKLVFEPFPGNLLMNSSRMTAWAVTAGYDEEITEGAVEALAYRIQSEQESREAALAEPIGNRLEDSYIEAVREPENIMPNYQMKWEQEIQNEFFTGYLPKLLDGTLEIDGFLELLDARNEEIRMKK
ncbi:MAG: extracellular solute-binding protein [Eubacteriales bacterium]|nr:extracellular solute-binding protein [Eubacteriales bacterium]